MNKKLIKFLAFIGALSLLMGCVPTTIDYSSETSSKDSTHFSLWGSEDFSVEESQEPPSKKLVENYEEENEYMAVVIYNGNNATIYDGFYEYSFGHHNSTVHIYYNEEHHVSENVTAFLPKELVFDKYFFYNSFDGTREKLYDFVLAQIGEDGKIIYYTDQANVLSRSN